MLFRSVPPTTEVPYQVVNVVANLSSDLSSQSAFWVQSINGERSFSWVGNEGTEGNIKMVDMTGKEIMTFNIEGESGFLTIKPLPPGIFIATLFIKGNYVKTKRFIVD